MDTQTNQTNIINPPAIGWRTIRENWQIIGAVVFGVGFLFVTYDKFKDLNEKVKEQGVKIQQLEANYVEKHDFEDLSDRFTRQWTIQSDNNTKLRAEFNPVRDWMFTQIGYEQALKDMKK